jgi:hypothetical protein
VHFAIKLIFGACELAPANRQDLPDPADQDSRSHFAMKLFFAAPLSGLPSDPTAFGAQASRLHLARKLFFAAPASGLPSFPTALLSHVPCAAAEPIANAVTKMANIKRFMSSLL